MVDIKLNGNAFNFIYINREHRCVLMKSSSQGIHNFFLDATGCAPGKIKVNQGNPPADNLFKFRQSRAYHWIDSLCFDL